MPRRGVETPVGAGFKSAPTEPGLLGRDSNPPLRNHESPPSGQRILEMGCGTGRNLPGLLQGGNRVYAVDFDFDAVSTAQSLLGEEGLSEEVGFALAGADALPFADQVFDEVHCIEVLHWASDTIHFEKMWMESWRVLKGGGVFFATLRSDSSDAKWFFADHALIESLAETCGGVWLQHSESSLALQKKP